MDGWKILQSAVFSKQFALIDLCLQQLCMCFMFYVLGAKPKHQTKAVNKSPLTKPPQRSETSKTSR